MGKLINFLKSGGRGLYGTCWVVFVLTFSACGGGGSSETVVAQSGSAAKSILTATPAAASPRPVETGWYWNPNEGGTGFMFEAQGSRAFVGFFLYEELTNKPIWYVAYGDVSLGGDGRYAFVGDLRAYHRGQTLTSFNYFSPSSRSVGEVRISFEGHAATVVLPGGRVMAATRFDIAGNGYDFDKPVPTTREQPEVGWYWDASRPGRGWAIEVQNNRLFLGMFHYNEDGSPTWNVVDTELPTGIGSGEFKRFSGGQSLTSAYRYPQSEGIGRYTLSFQNACRGLVQFEGFGALFIQRFRIDGDSLPAGAECRAEAENRFPMPDGLTPHPVRLQFQYGQAPIVGNLGSPGEVHFYATQMDPVLVSGWHFGLNNPGGAGTLPALDLVVYNLDGSILPPRYRSNGSYSFYPSVGGVYLFAVRSANGVAGAYQLTYQQGALRHLPGIGYRGFNYPLAGRYVGTIDGRLRGDIDVSFDGDGKPTGSLALVQPDGSVARFALAGSVFIDSTMQLIAQTANGNIVLDGFRSFAGVLAGAWTYVDGYGGKFVARRVPPAANTNPVAQVFPPGRILTGVPEPITGAASFDAEGDRLSYEWQVLLAPPGSVAARLIHANTPLPSFVADVAGEYIIQLAVEDGRGGRGLKQLTVEAYSLSAITLSPAP